MFFSFQRYQFLSHRNTYCPRCPFLQSFRGFCIGNGYGILFNDLMPVSEGFFSSGVAVGSTFPFLAHIFCCLHAVFTLLSELSNTEQGTHVSFSRRALHTELRST